MGVKNASQFAKKRVNRKKKEEKCNHPFEISPSLH